MNERLSYSGTKKLPEIFSENQINLILKTIRNSKLYWSESSKISKDYGAFLKARDISLIATIFILGLRPREACRLKFKDFNLTYLSVKIRGENNKTKKDRVIPIPKVLFDFYKQYFKFSRERFWKGSKYLFPSMQNQYISSERIKYIFREKVLKPAGLWQSPDKGKIPKYRLYTLRHSRASQILNKQIQIKGKPDLFAISNFLGHSDIRSTMVYLHTDKNYLNYLRDETEL